MKSIVSVTISATMIVKDEARCIKRAIKSLLQSVDEIVIVDTGSSDETINIVKKMQRIHDKVKLYEFEWCNDFAVARNYAIDKASSEWIFMVDADEELHPKDRKKLRELIDLRGKSSEFMAFEVSLCNTVGGEILEYVNKGIIRIFPKRSDIYYIDSIHEHIGNYMNMKIINCKIRLLHDGYDSKRVNLAKKKKRNRELLENELLKDPDNPRFLMYYASEVSSIDMTKSKELFDRARLLAANDPGIIYNLDYMQSRIFGGIKKDFFKEYLKGGQGQ